MYKRQVDYDDGGKERALAPRLVRAAKAAPAAPAARFAPDALARVLWDRAAAAVVAIDQLPRKIASVTDTKREKNAMSEDKINEEQRAATQTVAKALDDAIGDDGPVEHETATR